MAPFWKLMEMLSDGATRAHKPPLLETLVLIGNMLCIRVRRFGGKIFASNLEPMCE
jgi:hypothetical protein